MAERDHQTEALVRAIATLEKEHPELFAGETPNTIKDIVGGCHVVHIDHDDYHFRDRTISNGGIHFYRRQWQENGQDRWSLRVEVNGYPNRRQDYFWGNENGNNNTSSHLNVRFEGGAVRIDTGIDRARVIIASTADWAENASDTFEQVPYQPTEPLPMGASGLKLNSVTKDPNGLVHISYGDPQMAGPMTVVLPEVVTFHPSNT